MPSLGEIAYSWEHPAAPLDPGRRTCADCRGLALGNCSEVEIRRDCAVRARHSPGVFEVTILVGRQALMAKP
jgi:hypothetical protein